MRSPSGAYWMPSGTTKAFTLILSHSLSVTNKSCLIENSQHLLFVKLKEWDKISVKAFVVVGKFKSGMYDYDKNYVYIPLTIAQELVSSKEKDAVTGISVKLDDYRYANQVRDKLQAALGLEYYVQTWEDARKTFLTAVMMERHVMAFILFFILVVAELI